jgi:hypothetical protein
MEEPLILAKALAAKLIERRVPTVENELSKVCRKLPPQEILGVVVQLMGENVRAAAAIAVRAQLPVAQQLDLLHLVLALGQTNTIKALVSEVFAHRMSAEMFLNQLIEKREQFPVGVHFAAYYFLGAATMSSETRQAIRALLEETKPKQ